MRRSHRPWRPSSGGILFGLGASLLWLGCGSSDSSSTGGGGADGVTAVDLPCDVAEMLKGKCWSCHGKTPLAGAPMSLVTYADLTAPSKSDPGKTVAEKCLERMQSATAPMPPAGGLSTAEIAAMDAWIAAGTPKGSCGGGGAGGDPFGGGVVCTSGKTWTFGEDVSDPMRPQMHPGRACNDCHSKEDPLDLPPIFAVAGTVYPTGHEPDECYGVDGSSLAGVIVRVTDSVNRVYDLPVGPTGNFFLEEAPFDPPYSARVISPKGERAMGAKQTSGDCNLCHTEQGAAMPPSPAPPGRIVLP